MARAFVLTSDIHLQSDTDHGFHVWVETIEKALSGIQTDDKTILVLGDLWDFYIEGHTAFAASQTRFHAFVEELARRRIDFQWFEGNHDLYRPEANHIETSGAHKFYVCHGDLLNPHDVSYRRWKRLLHTPAVKFLAMHMPTKILIALGQRLSVASRTTWVKKKPWGWEAYRAEIARRAPKLRQEGVRTFVFGHCHWKTDEDIGGLHVINLGYFPSDGAVYVIDGEQQYWVSTQH